MTRLPLLEVTLPLMEVPCTWFVMYWDSVAHAECKRPFEIQQKEEGFGFRWLQSVPDIPLDIQMGVIHHSLSQRTSPASLMAVCRAWNAIVSREVYGAQVVHYLSSEKVEVTISHFRKSGSRQIFLCLAGLDWLFDEEVDWAYISKLSAAVFPRVKSLGLEGNRELIQKLIDAYAPSLRSLQELSIKLKVSLGDDMMPLDLSALGELRILRMSGSFMSVMPVGQIPVNVRSTAITSTCRHLELGSKHLTLSVARRIFSRFPELESCVLKIWSEGQSAVANHATTCTPFESPVTNIRLTCGSEVSMMLTGASFPKLLSLSAYERIDHQDIRMLSILSTLGQTSTPALASLSLTMTSFDVQYIHLLARVPTLISLDLSYLTINTDFRDFLSALTALTKVEMLPSLEDLSMYLAFDSGSLHEALHDDAVGVTNKTLGSLVKARRQNLRRLFIRLSDMTAEWQAGLKISPKLGYVGDVPEWVQNLWPHRPEGNDCVDFDTLRVDIPASLSEYGWIASYRDKYQDRGHIKVLGPLLLGGWFMTTKKKLGPGPTIKNVRRVAESLSQNNESGPSRSSLKFDHERRDIINLIFSTPLTVPIAIPLEIQAEIICLSLRIRISPATLMLVCKAWNIIASSEIYRARVVHSLNPWKVDYIISHFEKSGSRPIFLCLLEDGTFDKQEDWKHIERLSAAFFPRVRSLGLRVNQSMVQELMSRFGSMLQSLEEVSIRLKGGSVRLDLSALERLRILRLAGCWQRLQGTPFDLHPAAQITHLELAGHHLTLHVGRRMISLCPQLQSCVLQIGLVAENSPPLLTPFESQVRYLHLACTYEVAEMLHGGSFPRLEKLSVHEVVDRGAIRRDSIFSTLSPTSMPVLRSLSLTVALFDVDFVHLVARVPTLVSLNLPHLTIGTESRDILSFLTSLIDVKILPSLKHLSTWLAFSSHTLNDDGIIHANKTMVSVVKARQPTLQRVFISFPGLVADWQAGFHILPRLRHTDFMDDHRYHPITTPGWVRTIWPHHPEENRRIAYDPFIVWIPVWPSDYGWIRSEFEMPQAGGDQELWISNHIGVPVFYDEGTPVKPHVMPVWSVPSPVSVPIDIQMEIIHHSLSMRTSPRTLMAVCKAWEAIIASEIYGALVVHSLAPEKVKFIISHFRKAGSRPVFLCLLLDWFIDDEVEWNYIERLSVACFPKVKALGLRANQWLIQQLFSQFGSRLELLEELSIKLKEPSDATTPLDLSDLQHLRVIRLTGCWKQLDVNPFRLYVGARITHLELASQRFTIPVSRRMVSLCPELEFCILKIGLVAEDPPTPLIPFESQVKYLHLSCFCEAAEILRGGSFPRLQILGVHEVVNRATERTCSVFSTLSAASMPGLSSLSLAVASFDVNHIHCLARIPTLISLDLPHLTSGTEFRH
ncbi:hypothetical protein BDN72DRAFT_911780, partial [Pluteus cervinus]